MQCNLSGVPFSGMSNICKNMNQLIGTKPSHICGYAQMVHKPQVYVVVKRILIEV